ncbi:PBP1A family penicillin-binding protein [Patescibacteria group bacterium]|nr:PBP1A family penicillin-binding protein [Patescibacteria group bacterium]MBU4453392.1 PBP1A family penicillin-binding protein [Patescibacteria group bacterium]MCG2687542.1 PBP1A family penicillin-binding protein [Candidatus Parcubacteria bacterium]
MPRQYLPRNNRHTWAQSRKKNILAKIKSSILNIKHANKATLIKNGILFFISVALFGSIFMLGAFAWVSKDLPDPNSLTIREVAQSTKIYDRTGEHLLYEIAGDEKRTLVTLDQIPEYAVWATITAEDRGFYEHSGIDYKGILRAIFVDIITLSRSQGASTITQQLVKNAILSNEKTFTRKFKEIILSLALERRYTKDEIMQMYLNEIPYGSRNYGIEAASRAYFGISAEDLSLAQAATLAALPQATTYYLNNPEDLKNRRDWILGDMAELGYITQDEADAAKEYDTSIIAISDDLIAPHFVLWIKQQLEEEYGQLVVEQSGLTVISTLDFEMQQSAQTAVVNNRDARAEQYGFDNSGLVAIDPNNGQIMAMVGSVDYFNDDIDGQVNVTMQPLQPGSSIKPMIYAAGFEAGYTPNTILWDTKTEFGTETGPYSPNNYDMKEHGPLTVRNALQGSLNITAVKMLYLVGLNKTADFVKKMGYTTLADTSRYGLSIVLGGAEVKLIEHVSAYGVFATEGVYHAPVSILKVEDSDGEVLQEWKEEAGEKVLEQNIARMISDVLSDNVARTPFFGANSYLTLGSRPVAAKTGTTNDYKDAFVVGYTPQLVAGVWTGNTNGTAMNRGAGGSTVAAPIWNEFMKSALTDMPVEYFNAPEIPITGIPVLDGQMPSQEVTIDKASGKLATDLTPESYRETKICGEYHTILHYIDPNNPTAGVIESPVDGAYERWESSVQNYITNYNNNLTDGQSPLEQCSIPTEYDDLHTASNKPSVDVRSPKNNDSVGRSFTIEVRASANRGVDRIEYRIDGVVIKQVWDLSEITISLPTWVSAGKHTLTVVAYDDIDNQGEDEIKIDVTESAQIASVRIANPTNGQSIERIGEPYQVAIETSEPNILSLALYAQNLHTGAITLVSAIDQPTAISTALWTLGDTGTFLLYGHIIDQGNNQIDIEPVQVSVLDPTSSSSTTSFPYLSTQGEE